MSTPLHENELQKTTADAPIQDTIFNDYDASDMTGYDKNLKRARIYLYVVAGIQLVIGIFYFFKLKDEAGIAYALINSAIISGLGIVFLILAVWSYKKPVPAFLTALIVYILVHVADAIADPSAIVKGILLKILVIIALVKGYKDAKEFEEMKQSLGT